MILLFGRFGNHFHEGPSKYITDSFPFKSDEDVVNALVENGIDFNRLVLRCRHFRNRVPMFENLIGSTFNTVGSPRISRINWDTGGEDLIVNGPARMTIYDYWSKFEAAAKARDQAVERSSFLDFHSAIVLGIASIESYINYRAEIWNQHNPQKRLNDSREFKVSFEDKINTWIPEITGGKTLNKGNQDWNNYKILRRIRDDTVIHPKSSGYSISLNNLAWQINLFRRGIAGLLIQLHILLQEKIPQIIIRARYAPDVEIVLSS
jgi:hypothetical protein